MLRWCDSPCVTIILLVASVSQDLPTRSKAAEALLGGKRQDGAGRERGATDHEWSSLVCIRPALFTRNTWASDHVLKMWFCLLFNYEG